MHVGQKAEMGQKEQNGIQQKRNTTMTRPRVRMLRSCCCCRERRFFTLRSSAAADAVVSSSDDAPGPDGCCGKLPGFNDPSPETKFRTACLA